MNRIEKKLVNKNDLIELYELPPKTARNIITCIKKQLAQQGYDFYNNKRLAKVPHEAVKKFLNVA